MQMAEAIAAQIDNGTFGVEAMYVIGSTKNASAGPSSDIDLLIHCRGSDDQCAGAQDLAGWLEPVPRGDQLSPHGLHQPGPPRRPHHHGRGHRKEDQSSRQKSGQSPTRPSSCRWENETADFGFRILIWIFGFFIATSQAGPQITRIDPDPSHSEKPADRADRRRSIAPGKPQRHRGKPHRNHKDTKKTQRDLADFCTGEVPAIEWPGNRCGGQSRLTLASALLPSTSACAVRQRWPRLSPAQKNLWIPPPRQNRRAIGALPGRRSTAAEACFRRRQPSPRCLAIPIASSSAALVHRTRSSRLNPLCSLRVLCASVVAMVRWCDGAMSI